MKTISASGETESGPNHDSVQLIDSSNRKLDYLRVSVTDRCNMNCAYCLPFSRLPKQSHHDILRYEEMIRLIRIFETLGVTKIRITGGEPLVRKGIVPFIREINRIPGIHDLSMTTNGLLLAQYLSDIRSAGISRLNISLDSLDPATFADITGHDGFDRVWNNILAAHAEGFSPIKINMVVLRGVNDHELEAMAELSRRYPFHIRFIEYMPIGDLMVSDAPPIYTPEIRERIRSIGALLPVPREQVDGPARRFRFKDAPGEIGFISAMSRHFCHQCNRLRLTAGGFLRTCLLSDIQTDLKTPLRSGASDAELTRLIRQAIARKPKHHTLQGRHPARICSQMSAIGG